METNKMKGKSSVFLALRSKISSSTCAFGGAGVSSALPGFGVKGTSWKMWRWDGVRGAWAIPSPSWAAQVPQTQTEPHEFYTWCVLLEIPAVLTQALGGTVGRLFYCENFLLMQKHPLSSCSGGGNTENTKAVKGCCRSNRFWMFLFVLGKTRASYALLFAGA